MKGALYLLLTVLLVSSPQCPAQTGNQGARPVRYLLVVDTSFSMARQKPAVIRAVSDLILTGIDGRMTAGEAFAIWTFNEQVDTRRFPPQVWFPEQRQGLAQAAGQLVKSQRFEKQTRMDKAMVELSRLAKASDSLAIILLSDGDSSVSGTPFDRGINLAYLQLGRSLKKLRTPLITVLMVRQGQFVAWTVKPADQRIDWPELDPPIPAKSLPLPPRLVVRSENAPKPPPVSPPPSDAPSPPAPPASTEAVTIKVEPKPLDPVASQVESVQKLSTKALSGGSVRPETPLAVQPALTLPRADRSDERVESVQPEKKIVPAQPDNTAARPSQPIGEIFDPTKSQRVPPQARPSEQQPSSPDSSAPAAQDSGSLRSENSALAAAHPPETGHFKLVLGSILALAAIGLLLRLLRPGRPRTRSSLISRSLDADRQ